MPFRKPIFAAALVLAGSIPAAAEVVGKVGVDWVGNDIVIEAVTDPQVKGVTCHVTYFDRSIIDRLSKGNWFEDPSNNSIACRQTGRSRSATSICPRRARRCSARACRSSGRNSSSNRIYDKANDTLIYLVHSRQVVEGSAKMAISTVPLFDQPVTWTNGKPR